MTLTIILVFADFKRLVSGENLFETKVFFCLTIFNSFYFSSAWVILVHLIPANIRLDEDVLKTSFVFVFRRRLQDVLIKTNMFALTLRLQKTSSSRLGQDQYVCLGHMSSRRLQDLFKASSKTSSRCLQDIFKTSCKDIFKTFSRHTIKLTCSTKHVLEKYSTRFSLQRNLPR